MKIGIIGAGGVTRGVHVPALRLCEGVEIAGIARARSGEAFGGIPVTTHYEDLLERPEIVAIINATPNHLHKQITLEALRAGKHVLCEKPLGLNHAETLEMLRAAETSGLVHMTAFTFRYGPG